MCTGRARMPVHYEIEIYVHRSGYWLSMLLISHLAWYTCPLCVCVWYSGCVIGSGPKVPEFKLQLRQFFIRFSICLPLAPAVIGYLAFTGMQIQGLLS